MLHILTDPRGTAPDRASAGAQVLGFESGIQPIFSDFAAFGGQADHDDAGDVMPRPPPAASRLIRPPCPRTGQPQPGGSNCSQAVSTTLTAASKNGA